MTGTVRFRPAAIRGGDATDPDAAITEALALHAAGGRSRAAGARMLHGIAVRTDLSAASQQRLCTVARDIDSVSLAATLVANPTVTDADPLLRPAMIWLLLDLDPDRFARDILRFVDDPDAAPGGLSADQKEQVRDRLGPARLDAALDALLTSAQPGDHEAAAASTLLTPHHFDRLVEAATGGDRDAGSDLLGTLAARTDLTPEQADRIIASAATLGAGRRWDEVRPLIRLALNRSAPETAFRRLLTHRLVGVRTLATGVDHIPDSARWYAARRHFPLALIASKGPIPTEVAHVALDDLAAGRARGRVITGEDARLLLGALAQGCRIDRDLIYRFLAVAAPLLDGPEAAARAYLADLDSRRPDWAETSVGTTRTERALVVLADHPDAAIRAVVVPHLRDPEDLALAATDPGAPVRRAVAAHPRLPALTLRSLATDPDPQVAATVAERFMNALTREDT